MELLLFFGVKMLLGLYILLRKSLDLEYSHV